MSFLELILQDELLVRDSRQMNRRIVSACFRDAKRREDFDFSFNSWIKKNRIFDLATCHFIRERRDVLWLGPPGTGKSHLCQSIGIAAIRSGFTVYYRSIFDTVRNFLHDEAMDGHRRRGRIVQLSPSLCCASGSEVLNSQYQVLYIMMSTYCLHRPGWPLARSNKR